MHIWLPIDYSLPDNIVYKKVLSYGEDWQIIDTDKGKSLVATTKLLNKWVASGLIEKEYFNYFNFGNEEYGFFISGKNHILESLDSTLFELIDINDALSLATSLRLTREIDKEISLSDGIFVEKLSRILPTYVNSIKVKDDVLIGKWATSGVSVSIYSTERIEQLTLWSESQIRQIIKETGLKELDEKNNINTNKKRSDKFTLPGRPELEQFFNEHIIDFIQNKERYQLLGVNFPGAIILYGPPGSGKTFAVDKLVEFLDWPSYRVEASSVASPYIHETSKKIADIFEAAMQNSPSVLVIDEMEAFLSERDAGAGKHSVEEIAEFLRRIPEATQNDVLIIAMTNKLDMIDPAILRRGRFDHIVNVDYASREEIEAIIKDSFSKIPTEENLKIDNISEKLKQRPISDIAFFTKESARIAALNGKEKIDQESLNQALSKLLAVKTDETREVNRMGFI
jgi:AAA+ superfamily predicted ATPase